MEGLVKNVQAFPPVLYPAESEEDSTVLTIDICATLDTDAIAKLFTEHGIDPADVTCAYYRFEAGTLLPTEIKLSEAVNQKIDLNVYRSFNVANAE